MRVSRIQIYLTGLVFICVGLLVPLSPASAADTPVMMALKTAIFHGSELAQRGAAVEASQVHVQHIMNCLEGPGGANYKQAAGYPCQGQGFGIIPDLTTAAAGGVKGAERALRLAKAAREVAQQALASKDVNEVQPFAKVIATNLQLALDALQ